MAHRNVGHRGSCEVKHLYRCRFRHNSINGTVGRNLEHPRKFGCLVSRCPFAQIQSPVDLVPVHVFPQLPLIRLYVIFSIILVGYALRNFSKESM